MEKHNASLMISVDEKGFFVPKSVDFVIMFSNGAAYKDAKDAYTSIAVRDEILKTDNPSEMLEIMASRFLSAAKHARFLMEKMEAKAKEEPL